MIYLPAKHDHILIIGSQSTHSRLEKFTTTFFQDSILSFLIPSPHLLFPHHVGEIAGVWIPIVRMVERGTVQSCQIFLGPKIPKREKYTKEPQTTPNGHTLFQMAMNYTKWP
jgi:hypothetical protein